MRIHRIIFSGAGGQGLMFVGKLLAGLAMDEFPHITCMPSYGAEVRGGTSNCQVILSDDVIATPNVAMATAAVLMNQPSVDRFLPALDRQGIAVVNESLASASGDNVLLVPASEIALELGDVRAANVVMFAAFLNETELIDKDKALSGVQSVSKRKGDRAVEINTNAFERGWGYLTAVK